MAYIKLKLLDMDASAALDLFSSALYGLDSDEEELKIEKRDIFIDPERIESIKEAKSKGNSIIRTASGKEYLVVGSPEVIISRLPVGI